MLLLLFLIFFADRAYAYADDAKELVSDHIEEFKSKTKCSIVSVAVVDGDKTELYGDAEGLYQIGSMTKAFTGLAIQKLIAEGAKGNIVAILPDRGDRYFSKNLYSSL